MAHRMLGLGRVGAALCVGLLAVLTALGWWVVGLDADQRAASRDARVVAEASVVRGELEARLNGTVLLARGLSGLVVASPDLDGLGSGTGVGRALADVHERGRWVRNIGLAPDNVLQHVFPLEGNESAIGLRYEDVPAQWADVQRAIELRETVLAGPVELVQGGRGLISRTPVFLEDDVYWGVVSLVVDVDGLVADVDAATASSPVEWAVRTVPADAGAEPALVAGDADLFGDATTLQTVSLPGTRWEFAAAPGPGLDVGGAPLVLLRSAVLVLAGLLTGLVAAVVHERALLRDMSWHDPLTGLRNRRALGDAMERALLAARRGDGACTVLYLDLDGFKPVNDELGHEAGDAVLAALGERLVGAVDDAAVVARVGGDEFVVLLPTSDLAAAAHEVAQRVRAAVAAPIDVAGTQVVLGVSVGAASFPEHGDDATTLLIAADQAMYAAKHQRRRGGDRRAGDRRAGDRRAGARGTDDRRSGDRRSATGDRRPADAAPVPPADATTPARS